MTETAVDLMKKVKLFGPLLCEQPKPKPRPPPPAPPDELPPEFQVPEPLPPDLFPIPKLPDERPANLLPEGIYVK